MKKAPSFQFYAQDFLTGVMYLTNEEKGIYITMLAKQWTDGRIPKKRLGFLVGISWDKFSDELKSKFEDMGDYLVNTRLEEEREKKRKFLKSQSENGKKGGRPPKKKETLKPKQNPIESQKKPLEEEEEEEEVENEIEIEIENEVEKKEIKKIEFQKIVDIFNSVCHKLPKVQKVTAARKSAINARVREYGLSKIGDVFQKTAQSEFLNGHNDRGWTADFDWVMNPNNFIKILEGKYETKKRNTNNTGGASDAFRAKTAKRLGIV